MNVLSYNAHSAVQWKMNGKCQRRPETVSDPETLPGNGRVMANPDPAGEHSVHGPCHSWERLKISMINPKIQSLCD